MGSQEWSPSINLWFVVGQLVSPDIRHSRLVSLGLASCTTSLSSSPRCFCSGIVSRGSYRKEKLRRSNVSMRSFSIHLEEDRVLCGKDCQEMMELLNPRQDQAGEAPTGHKILQSFSSISIPFFLSMVSLRVFK